MAGLAVGSLLAPALVAPRRRALGDRGTGACCRCRAARGRRLRGDRPPSPGAGGRDRAAALAAAVRAARRAGARGPRARPRRAAVPAGTVIVPEGEPATASTSSPTARSRSADGRELRPLGARRRLRRDRAAARRAAHGDRRGATARACTPRQGHLPRRRVRPPAGRKRGRPARPRAPALGAGDNRTVIDPLERWRQYGEKPDYAGLLTYGGAPYTQDPAELAGFDVAIVGAPTDDLVSDRPGARFGPRAIRAAFRARPGRTSSRRSMPSRS